MLEDSATPSFSPMADMGEPSECTVTLAIKVIGGKWKMMILRVMMVEGPCRYNDLIRDIDGISAKELTRNLRELQDKGLVVHQDDPKAHYALTDVATELTPIFHQLGEWADRWGRARR